MRYQLQLLWTIRLKTVYVRHLFYPFPANLRGRQTNLHKIALTFHIFASIVVTYLTIVLCYFCHHVKAFWTSLFSSWTCDYWGDYMRYSNSTKTKQNAALLAKLSPWHIRWQRCSYDYLDYCHLWPLTRPQRPLTALPKRRHPLVTPFSSLLYYRFKNEVAVWTYELGTSRSKISPSTREWG